MIYKAIFTYTISLLIFSICIPNFLTIWLTLFCYWILYIVIETSTLYYIFSLLVCVWNKSWVWWTLAIFTNIVPDITRITLARFGSWSWLRRREKYLTTIESTFPIFPYVPSFTVTRTNFIFCIKIYDSIAVFWAIVYTASNIRIESLICPTWTDIIILSLYARSTHLRNHIKILVRSALTTCWKISRTALKLYFCKFYFLPNISDKLTSSFIRLNTK